MTKIKTIRSYAGLARYLATVHEAGWIPRCPEIPTPYSSGPTHLVYDDHGRQVIVCETAHKRYEVFAVPSSVLVYATDDQATEVFIAQRRLEQDRCAAQPSGR